jgi:hypothetical protein
VFNWVSTPTFAAMLLFWILAAYVLSRSPRSPISILAFGQIMAWYSISESSFHRLRRQAIKALAQDMGERETQLGQSGSS